MTLSARGMTLVELLIVLVITAILASALGYAFTAELTMQRIEESRRASHDRDDGLERQVTRLLQGAKLSAPAPIAPPGVLPMGQAAGAAAAPSAPTTYFEGVTENNANDLGCDRLTFTTTAPMLPMAALYGTDDFETQHQARGPVGGLMEVSLSVTAVGDSGGRTGLFERRQQPSDADPSQGGFESVLDSQVAKIGFQFWNGSAWIDAWPQSNPPRLPQAVRVRYTLKSQPATDIHVFDVPLPTSDVDAQRPQETESSQ